MNTLFLILQIGLSGITALHALTYKRDSRSALCWIVVCFILPFIGPFFYYAFGINRVAYRAKSLSNQHPNKQIFSFKRYSLLANGSDLPNNNNIKEKSDYLNKFGAVSHKVSKASWRSGNSIKVLVNGEEAYPEMLKVISEAKNTIYLMTYIFNTDKFGREFIQALKEAKERGVEVKVIVDSVAYLYSVPTASKLLTKAGIENLKFSTSSLFPPSFGINLRNHRKLLLVDSNIAFTGGMNIAGINFVTNPSNKKPKQDTHFKLSGPIVADCYKVFSDTWYFLSKEAVYIPSNPVEHSGGTRCKLTTDGPDEELDKIDLILIDAVVSATSSIKIMTPYFIPSREFISALNNAALRGVTVEIILPEQSDSKFVDYATRNMLWELLQRGVKVYYQPGPFNHSKILIADSEYTIVGSANIDPRSLRLNYELILEVIDDDAVKHLDDIFNEKRNASKPVSLEKLEARSLLVRIRDSFCWLFSPYL